MLIDAVSELKMGYFHSLFAARAAGLFFTRNDDNRKGKGDRIAPTGYDIHLMIAYPYMKARKPAELNTLGPPASPASDLR